MKTTVKNMTNHNGKKITNQFIIHTEDNKTIFQSYDSIIVEIDEKTNKVTLGKNWDYSKTTGKYRNIFLNEDKKTTLSKIKNGEYIVDENL